MFKCTLDTYCETLDSHYENLLTTDYYLFKKNKTTVGNSAKAKGRLKKRKRLI